MCLRRKHLSGKSIADIRLAVALPAGLSLLYLLDIGGSSLLAEQPTSISLNRDLTVEQYDYREWSMEDGLPSEQIADIVQTQDGYLWLATENGVARFDGVKFTTFNRSNTPALVTNNITTLFESRDGTLWIGTLRGGLVRCRTGQPPEFERFEQLAGYTIQCLREDLAGTLWIGTDVETWTLRDDECEPSSDAPLNVMAICQDEEGRLWLGASIWMGSRPESLSSSEDQPQPGLFRVDGEQFHRLTEADGFPQSEMASSVKSLCTDAAGGMWIGTREGLLRFRHGKCVTHAGPVSGAQQYFDILQDRGGQLWVGTFAAGLHRLPDGRRLPQGGPAKAPFGIRPIRCIVEDRDGNIWFGGGQRGLRCISNPELLRVKLGVNEAAVRGLVEDSAGDLWFGSGVRSRKDQTRTGLHRLRHGNLESFGTRDGLPTHLVTGLALGSDGRLWVGTHKGLVCRGLDGQLTTFTTADGLGRNWIRSVHADRAGVVWIGFWEGGLQRLVQGTFTRVAEFGDADVNFFHEDAGGVLWIGSNRGLYRWRNDQLQRITDSVLDKLPTYDFSACCEDQQGQLWLGTNGGGICRYADGHFANWSSEQGLHEDVIHAIQLDQRDDLWLGGAHGLTSLPIKSFDDFETGTIQRLPVRVHQHGMRFGQDYRPNVLRRSDGSLWFKTADKVVVVPADGPYQHPLPPLVHIEEVDVDGESIGGNAAFEVLSRSRHIDFHYTATTFAAPERARFRYQLAGFDDGWIDAGSQRIASYTDLPPGEYLFRVTADNGHDVWSEEGAAIGFTVAPQWFETVWFRVVLALGLTGLAVIAVQRYTAGMRRRNVLLSESEARFRSLSDASPMLIWTSDKDKGCTYVNSTWLAFTGRRLQDDFGDGWAESIHPDDRDRCLEIYGTAFDRREGFEMTYQLRRHDGEYRWMLDCGSPRFERDGSFAGYVGSAFDITERKLTREALQESKRRYEMASQVAHFGYWHRNLRDNTGYWSKEMYRIFGVPESFDPVFENVLERFHPDDRVTARESLELARIEGRQYDLEVRIHRPDGSERIVHSVADVIISDENGEVVAVTGVMQDITERKRAEDEAQRNREQLLRVGRAASMGEIAATIAHEVSQPLFAIARNSQTAKRLLLRETPDIDEVRESLDDIAGDSKRASDVVERVRWIFKSQQPGRHGLDLNELIRETAALFRPDARRLGASVKLELSETLPRVVGDPLELQQVILNLLTNGAQAMESVAERSRELVVRSSLSEENSAHVEVQDGGIGIQAENLARIFESFFTTKPDGIGIGLAINRSIIESHGGKLWATQNERSGATLHFTLPVEE